MPQKFKIGDIVRVTGNAKGTVWERGVIECIKDGRAYLLYGVTDLQDFAGLRGMWYRGVIRDSGGDRMTKILYKFTDQNMQTHGGCQWVLGEKKTTSGEGELCGPGWLHCYADPLLAVLLNPIHADYENPRLFRARVGRKSKHDHGLKSGYTKMTLIRRSRYLRSRQRSGFGSRSCAP